MDIRIGHLRFFRRQRFVNMDREAKVNPDFAAAGIDAASDDPE
jgi:hypothetical protein